ncbi:MAG TPA: hypothetical protein VFE33_16985 [Thermoanaerobaculia bacterium]|nr:hypothetical protein [Thermoanaerobaculia bacterium]
MTSEALFQEREQPDLDAESCQDEEHGESKKEQCHFRTSGAKLMPTKRAANPAPIHAIAALTCA